MDIKEVTFEDVLLCYFQHVPCIYQGCGNDISWLGMQHGCISGHACEAHLNEFVEGKSFELSERGKLVCRCCNQSFTTFDSYFRAVKV